jgi:hypothetical protein
MAALRRYAVSTQATASAEECRECSSDGSAGMTIDCRRLYDMAARQRTAKDTR